MADVTFSGTGRHNAGDEVSLRGKGTLQNGDIYFGAEGRSTSQDEVSIRGQGNVITGDVVLHRSSETPVSNADAAVIPAAVAAFNRPDLQPQAPVNANKDFYFAAPEGSKPRKPINRGS